jgi:hypothetical protein
LSKGFTNLSIHSTFSKSVKSVEYNPTPVTREVFIEYLQHLLNYVKSSCEIIEEKAIKIGANYVVTENQTIEAEHIILAMGGQTTPKIPNYINTSILKSKITPAPKLIKDPPINKKIAVIGSGQGAAEVVNLLSTNNEITWVNRHPIKVKQYPAPSYSEWGLLSALGPHYRGLVKWEDRVKYLGKVKQWQPSLTPYVMELLNTKKYTLITDLETSNIDDTFDHIVISTGPSPNVSNIPFDFEVPLNTYLPTFPDLELGFKLINYNIYFTGLLAVAYDGPRQASFVSAGLTSQEITRKILNA